MCVYGVCNIQYVDFYNAQEAKSAGTIARVRRVYFHFVDNKCSLSKAVTREPDMAAVVNALHATITIRSVTDSVNLSDASDST